MFKKAIFSLLAPSFHALAAHPLGHSRFHQRDTSSAYALCLETNPGCREVFSLVQKCWDVGVPSGMLDPNDGVVSENFRTCFCGDQKTTDDGSWPSCANCVKNKGMESIYANMENTDIVRFCATPDPNLYLWLTNFLNFTLTTNPSALASSSPILTGPITAISTLASAYSADPSANIIPSGIFHLTTDTVSTLPPLPTASTSHSRPNDNDNTSGGGGNGGAQTRPAGNTDAVLTVLYYTNSATSMYIVGPASELASLNTATSPGAAQTLSATASSVTTGVFVQGGRTVLIVGPATGTATGEEKARKPDGWAAQSEANGRAKGEVSRWLAGLAGVGMGVVVGVAVLGGRFF